jgi:hypothetical protein
VIAWQLNQRATLLEHGTVHAGANVNLRMLTGAELNRHLARLGA